MFRNFNYGCFGLDGLKLRYTFITLHLWNQDESIIGLAENQSSKLIDNEDKNGLQPDYNWSKTIIAGKREEQQQQ